jgi:hypothetical protein
MRRWTHHTPRIVAYIRNLATKVSWRSLGVGFVLGFIAQIIIGVIVKLAAFLAAAFAAGYVVGSWSRKKPDTQPLGLGQKRRDEPDVDPDNICHWPF